MADLVDVSGAARELGVNASRVRALISSGVLDAEKIGGRWLIDRTSVAERGREPSSAGRPLAPRNAWALLLAASGEEQPHDISPATRWRLRQGLAKHGLLGLRPRLGLRADIRRFWALPGELRALRDQSGLALSGSSAAGAYDLELVAPDTIDAYVPEHRIADLIDEHALDAASPASANVILRAVPDDAWLLSERRVAPLAAVALDLAAYPDPRSARVGKALLDRLDHHRTEA
jgi:excisionase family DNA binding protein